MIASRSLKRLLAEIALLMGVLVALAAILLATNVISFSSTSADPASALHQVAELPPEADALVSWAPDVWSQERTMEPATRIALEAAYVRAWAALGVYQSTGATTALTTMFSGSARKNALAMPGTDEVATWSVAHRLQLEFYSLDGATVALTDTGARLARSFGTGTAETVVDASETYAVVMVLEDGYWRIRQLRRLPGSTATVTTGGADGLGSVTGTAPVIPIPVAALNSTDYTPAGWPDTTPETMAADFARARDLGLTAVRLRIPFDALTSTAGLARLPDLMDAAQAAGLQVILVLSDGVPELSPGSWAAVDHGAAGIADALRGHPAPVLWDVADQPDRRSPATSTAEATAFVVHVAGFLHALAPPVAVTASWGDIALAADPRLAGVADLVSLSWTGPATDLSAAIDRTQSAIGDRPLMVIASTTSTDGGWSPLPHSERRQATEVAEVLTTTAGHGITRTSINQLIDTATSQQGFLRGDDSNKPAAVLIAPGAALSTVSGPGLGDYAGSKFWRTAALCLVIGAVVLFRRPLLAGLARVRHRRDRASGHRSRSSG